MPVAGLWAVVLIEDLTGVFIGDLAGAVSWRPAGDLAGGIARVLPGDLARVHPRDLITQSAAPQNQGPCLCCPFPPASCLSPQLTPPVPRRSLGAGR